MLVKHCSAGETRFAGQTCFAAPNANTRPNADYRPNAHCRLQRELPAGRKLPPKRNLLARTQFAGTKNKVTEFFSFGASDHDGVFSFPAALGGAEAYLFRWLVSSMHLIECSGDNHPLISLEGLRIGPSRTCSVALSRSILSSGGIVAYAVLGSSQTRRFFQKACVKSASVVCQKRLSYGSVYIHKRSTDDCQSTFSQAL